MTNLAVDPAVERYLGQVRSALRGMPDPEIDDILLELRGHIAERVESSHDLPAALASLGDPVTLARTYRNDEVLARGECANSPLAILHSLMLLRRQGRGAGWLVFALATFGYALAIALAAAAGEKFLSPKVVGLWHTPGAPLPRILIDGAPPAGSHELLGWWFVPAAATAFLVLLLATNRLGHWWIRRRRSSDDDLGQRFTRTDREGPVGSA